jgi:glutaredoxin 3
MPRIEVFSGPGCTYCAAAKDLLRQHRLAFEELDIKSSGANLGELRRRLPRSTSIPQIFVDGEHIGGFEDLQLYLALSKTAK